LELSENQLQAVQLPSTFTLKSEIDPIEHFGIDPKDYMDTDEMVSELERHGMHVTEPDYGND
jgi:hypothetical protein